MIQVHIDRYGFGFCNERSIDVNISGSGLGECNFTARNIVFFNWICGSSKKSQTSGHIESKPLRQARTPQHCQGSVAACSYLAAGRFGFPGCTWDIGFAGLHFFAWTFVSVILQNYILYIYIYIHSVYLRTRELKTKVRSRLLGVSTSPVLFSLDGCFFNKSLHP